MSTTLTTPQKKDSSTAKARIRATVMQTVGDVNRLQQNTYRAEPSSPTPTIPAGASSSWATTEGAIFGCHRRCRRPSRRSSPEEPPGAITSGALPGTTTRMCPSWDHAGVPMEVVTLTWARRSRLCTRSLCSTSCSETWQQPTVSPRPRSACFAGRPSRTVHS
jgi:hypothetical protein